MDYNTVKKIVEEVEETANVSDIRYGDKHVWPIIKYYLFFDLLKKDNKEKKTADKPGTEFRPTMLSRLKYYSREPISFITDYISDRKEERKLKQLNSVDVLFIDVLDIEYIEKKDGKSYSHYVSPYISFFKKKSSFLFLNAYPLRSGLKNKFETPYYYYSKPYFGYQKIISRYRSKFMKSTGKISGDGLLSDLLEKKGAGEVFDKPKWESVLDDVILWEKFWIRILKILNPKVVFFECYYGNENYYGLISAAKKMGCKSVDVQHGISLHPMYTGWNKVPSRGYEFLPDNYWCWSRFDRENIIKTRKGINTFIPVVGGNLWLLDYFSQEQNNPVIKTIKHDIQQLNPAKVILVTLQHSIPVSEILIRAIKSSPDNWRWLIRFHPLDYVDPDYRKSYIEKLSGFSNVEFRLSTEANMYDLLRLSNVHITHHSTAAIEAITFKVPTILLGTKFKEIYNEFIINKHFYIAETAEEILNLINKDIKIGSETYDFYKMEYSETCASKSLNELLAGEYNNDSRKRN